VGLMSGWIARGERAYDRLGRRNPRLSRAAWPFWRLARRLAGRPTYWDRRRRYRYYETVLDMARRHAPEGGRVLDVGAYEGELLRRFDWFDSRLALDVRYMPPRRGVETIVADFLDWEPGGSYELVLCLQVLEHVPDPPAFASKLLRTGRLVILSVPYRWPADALDAHAHDPVDEAKLRDWTGLDPLETAIVDDGRERLIAVYAPRPR